MKVADRRRLDRELASLLDIERTMSFDPGGNEADFATLQSLLAE